MSAPTTFHTFSSYKSWPAYHAAYLRWMQKADHPDLRASNFNASTWKDRMIQQRLIAPP